MFAFICLYVRIDVQARENMFKLGLKDTPNTLSDINFSQLSENTDGFSGADICILVRDATMEPVRNIQSATHFNLDSEGFYTPCNPDAPDAKEITWTDLPCDKLKPRRVTMKDLTTCLSRAKPSVSDADLAKFEIFKEKAI